MKSYIYSLVALSLLFSCSKSALEVAPLDRLSSGNFWKTEADANAALTSVYATIKDNGSFTQSFCPILWDGLTDDGYSQYGNLSIQNISQVGPTPTTGGLVSDIYGRCYKGIAYANSLLANIEKITMADANKKIITAEASFLRAYFYFQLAYLYGNVIIISAPATKTFKDEKTKSTRDEVLTFINTDLDVAIADLPDKVYSDGHVVKGTAQALKVRALLLQKKYAEAAIVAKAVIDAGKFKLSANYMENFAKPGQNTTKEIMFSIKTLAPNSFPVQGADLVLGTWQSYQPTSDLVNEYEAIDGVPISKSTKYDAAKPYENRDPRLKMTIFVSGEKLYTGTLFVPFTGSNTTGFATKKSLDPTITNAAYGTVSTQDIVLIRYAEIILSYAEAENEANGPAMAYAAVNEIRTRAGMPALAAGLSKDEMREKIRHERRVELAMEGLRYFDLRRWGIAKEKLNGFEVVKGNAILKKVFYDSKFDFWPIPQTDIDRVKGLIQNPGY